MLNLYSIKDIKANRFQGVVPFPNDDMAKRAFTSAVNSSESAGLLSQYPEDVQIFRLGSFDDVSGEIQSKQEFLWNGLDLKIKGGE